MQTRPRLDNPLLVLGIGLCFVLLFAGLFCLLQQGDKRTYNLYYTVPIALPFIAFILDRMECRPEWTSAQRKLDAATVFFALLRSIATHYLTFLSGHVLFLTYSLLTSRSWAARITAVLVGIEVLYLKIFAWHKPEWIGGILLGLLAAGWFHYLKAKAARVGGSPAGI